jgi:hypothetical protein
MNNSDYTSIRVETSGGLFGLEPTQPGKERKREEKNGERRSKRAAPEEVDPSSPASAGAAETAADEEDPHTVDYRA